MALTIENHVYREGEGIPLILVHGFPVDHRMWDRCATALMERSDAQERTQYPIWAPDMPGAGASPVPAVGESGRVDADGALPDALDLMADAYVDLLRAAGHDRAIWAGLSMGGYLVLDIQRRHPEAVAGLALLDTKGDADSPASRANRIRIAHACVEGHTVEPVMFFTEPHPEDSSVKRSREYIDRFGEWIGQQRPEGVAWRELMAAGRPDLNDQFAAVVAPAAVICGEEDPSSSPRVMEPIARAMTGTQVAMTEIEDCGHFSAWERPEIVAQALHELIARVPRPIDRNR